MSKHADTVTLRRAEPDERQALEDLQRRASLELPEYREQLLANPDAISLSPDQIPDVIVAESEGRIVGFAALVGNELDGLFVEPDMWAGGVGSSLVGAAVHHARVHGLSLTVLANPTARGFYEKCGFTMEGEEPTRFGPGLRMSR